MIELVTGVLFLQAALSISQGAYLFFILEPFQFIYLIYTLAIVSALIVIFFTDLFSGIIPFLVILPAIGIVAAWLYGSETFLFSQNFFAALGAAGFFLIIFLITRGRGMGFGDVVFAFFMGLLLGFPNIIVGLYIAFLTGGVVSLILILLKRKKLHGSTIAFGPFLVLGTYLCLFWGDGILKLVRTVLHI